MSKAVFFDFDGTLVDSRADLVSAVNHTRRDLGLADKSFDEVLRYVGRGARKLIVSSVPEFTEDGEQLFTKFMTHYREHMLDSVCLYPGVEATLEELHRRGWKLAINTCKPGFATRDIVEKLGLSKFFGEAIVAGGDEVELKPSKESMLLCADKLSHQLCSDDWMVGDSWVDVECARNVGVHSAFCAFGFGKLLELTPELTLNAFDELLNYLT